MIEPTDWDKRRNSMKDLTNSLTPFVRHDMQNTPGPAGAPEAAGSLLSPPLGKPPVANIANTETTPQAQPQPDPTPLATPHPGPQAAPQGTAVPCHQKNAADFLAGNTPGVMAYYDPGSPKPLDPEKGQYARDVQNAPPQAAVPTQEDEDTVRHLVEWREEATY
jgi:hypothetical protein